MSQKPILGARLNRSHPQARGLRHAWVFNEGSGRVVNDAVGDRHGTLAGASSWEARGVERGVNVVNGTTQYVDVGDVDALDGVSQFTIVERVYRASSSDFCEINKGSVSSSRVAIQLHSDGFIYFSMTTTGTTEWGTISGSSITGVHTFAMVFDGTQATNATRLKGYLDGVAQSLTFTGTIGAATASTSDPLQFGHCQYNNRYSNGSFYYVLIYDRALTAEEIAQITLDPFAPWDDDLTDSLVVGSPVSLELPVADVSVQADSLMAAIGTALILPEANVSLQADGLVAGNAVELPSVSILVDAIAPFAVTESTLAVFSNISPAPDAAGYRGADRVTVDVTSPYPVTHPVAAATITIAVNGVPLTVSTSTISAGFRATAPYRWNDEQTYEVEITAETTSSVGAPTIFTYTFTVGFWVVSPAGIEGVAAALRSSRLVLDGSVAVVYGLSPAISGNALQVGDNYIRLDGSVGTALDLLRSGEVVILDGWVTLYVSELLLWASIGPLDGVAEPVDLSIEAWDPVAGVPGLEATLDVYSVDGHPGLDGAVDIRQPVEQSVELAIGPIDPVSESVDLSIDVDGYAASGMVVVDSPSAEWVEEQEAEDA